MLSATGLLRFALLLVFFLLHATQPAGAGSYAFTVRGDKTFLNGQEFLVKGLRCSNALISDRTTQDLIDNLDTSPATASTRSACTSWARGSAM